MKSSIFSMKKVLILLTIFLISCGSEEGTYDLHHPAEEVNGVSLVDCLVIVFNSPDYHSIYQ